jgi:hypothetical protein
MGHVRNGHGIYGRLQKRLDRFPIGAPPAEALFPTLKRLYTEEVAGVMAIERGKLANLLFDDFDRIDRAALRAVTRIIIALPPVKKALLSRQAQSAFLRALAD